MDTIAEYERFKIRLCSIVADCTYPRKIPVDPVYSTGMFIIILSEIVMLESHFDVLVSLQVDSVISPIIRAPALCYKTFTGKENDFNLIYNYGRITSRQRNYIE